MSTIVDIYPTEHNTIEADFQFGPLWWNDIPTYKLVSNSTETYSKQFQFLNEFEYVILAIQKPVYRFDTTSLSGKTLTSVKLYRKFSSFPAGATNYTFRYYFDNITIAANAATYNNTGTLCYTESAGSFVEELLDFGSAGVNSINPTGFTGLRITNIYNEFGLINDVGHPEYLPDGVDNAYGETRFDATQSPIPNPDCVFLRVEYADVVDNKDVSLTSRSLRLIRNSIRTVSGKIAIDKYFQSDQRMFEYTSKEKLYTYTHSSQLRKRYE